MLKIVPLFRVTYLGEGVVANKLGAFQNGTTAYTEDEQLARELSSQSIWRITDRGGALLSPPQKEPETPKSFDAPKSFETPVANDSPRDHGKRRHKDQGAQDTSSES